MRNLRKNEWEIEENNEWEMGEKDWEEEEKMNKK